MDKYPVVFTRFEDLILDVGLKVDNSDSGILAPGPFFDKRYGGCNFVTWIDSGIRITKEKWREISFNHSKNIYICSKSGSEILADLGGIL